MKSIMQSDTSRCYLCARNGNGDRLEKHHVFGGSNRKFSEEDGLTVFLCGDSCHRNGPFSAHRNKDIADYLESTTDPKLDLLDLTPIMSKESWNIR